MKEYCSGQELLSIVISLKPSLFFFSALFVLLSWPAKETSARPAGWTLMNTPSNIYFVYVSGRCLYREQLQGNRHSRPTFSSRQWLLYLLEPSFD